jgi:hypothetical protein
VGWLRRLLRGNKVELVECADTHEGHYCWLIEGHRGAHSCVCGGTWTADRHSVLSTAEEMQRGRKGE